GDPESLSLRLREDVLESGPGQAWMKLEQPPSCMLRSRYRRGFLAEVVGTMAQWVKSAGALFRMAPIRFAAIDVFGIQLRRFVASPCLARLSHLRLTIRWLSDVDAEVIAGSAPLAAVPRIEIMNSRGGPVWTSPQAERCLRASFGTRLQMQRLEPDLEP